MVVQELRTPLTNMKTALSLLGSPSLKPPQRQRYIQLLNTECDRQGSLIRGLLDLSQIEQSANTAMQPLTLSEVVPGVVSNYQSLAQEKEIALTYSIPEALPNVACLLPWLRQILVNLLHNSIKCTDKGGSIVVRAKRQGDYVQIDVQDTGVGIAASEIPKIFNRFYRVRAQGVEDTSGAGLGLTIVQQFLLRCGGSITVNSRLGQGSTFAILLPIYGGASSGASESVAAAS
jgi:two-component system, OmpR family, phosphate regulon sensor histidine kinase PhoR